MSAHKQYGFSLVEVLVGVFLIALLGVGGWYVWQRHGQKDAGKHPGSASQAAATTGKQPTATIPAGWIWYENEELGLKVAHPKEWIIGTPTPVGAVNGHDGLQISITPDNLASGDPIVGISTFPIEASVKDTDGDPSAVRILTLKTGDGQEVTLAGGIEQPSAAEKPTAMGATTCWPHGCSIRLRNGRTLDMGLAGFGPDCQPHVACFTEINQDSQKFGTAIAVLKTVTSL